MRFLTFLKQNLNQYTDAQMTEFANWYLQSSYASKNPHAGIPQIDLYLKLNDIAPDIYIGFLKWKVLFLDNK